MNAARRNGIRRWIARARLGLAVGLALAVCLPLAGARAAERAATGDAVELTAEVAPLPPVGSAKSAGKGLAQAPGVTSDWKIAPAWPGTELGPATNSADTGPVFTERFPTTAPAPTMANDPAPAERPVFRAPAAAPGQHLAGPPAAGASELDGFSPVQHWQKLPWSVGVFAGWFHGSPLLDDWLDQSDGFLGGFRLGFDFDAYWTAEFRCAFGGATIHDSDRALNAQADPRRDYHVRRSANYTILDGTFLYYPWGDRRWRPYVMTGLGFAEVEFSDVFRQYSASVIDIPLGVGVKYHVTDRLGLRLEVSDDLIFGVPGGFNTLHNLSVNGSFEIRFGGARRSYWPWYPGMNSW